MTTIPAKRSAIVLTAFATIAAAGLTLTQRAQAQSVANPAVAQTWIWGDRAVSRCTAVTCAGAIVPIANTMAVWGVEIKQTVQVSHVLLDVVTGDASGSYSVGIYGPLSACSTTCPLVASTAAATYATSQARSSVPFSQGLVTLLPGVYFIGWTGTGTALQLALSGGYNADRYNAYLAIDDSTPTSGGAAPATINRPTLQLTAGVSVTTILPFFYLTQLACGTSC